MYILKNMERLQEIPFTEYRDGIFKRLGELSRVSNMTEEEKALYNANLKWSRDYHSTLEFAREEGEANKAREIALNLKHLGVDIDTIAKSSGLSHEEIARL